MKDEKDSSIDVLDSNYHLMIKLKNCPGTYGHSKNVASIMESVGSELGLNVPAMKIAGFFHDIGKTVCPHYFVENQTDETGNIHDKLPPHVSFRIIASHPSESVNILINDPNIDRQIAIWCSQHHGTTLMRSIFSKADTQNSESYRYKGHKPQSLEAGILMVCDQLEAKCRALFQANKLTDMEAVVNQTFDHITVEDEQWDHISLTFRDIRVLKEVICQELKSMYKPKRLEYPEPSMTTEDPSSDGNAEVAIS